MFGKNIVKGRNCIVKSETQIEVMEKLVGPFTALGDASRDDQRLENLQELGATLDYFIGGICEEAFNVNRYEHSMNQSGKTAVSILQELYDAIRNTLESIQEEKE